MQSPTSPPEETQPDSSGPRGQEPLVQVEHAPHAGEDRSDSSPPSSYMPPSPTTTDPEPATPKATFTTNIRPYSASGLPSPPRGAASATRPTAGPSISTRTSFTRVETEDEQAHQTPFPARPATASAASSSSAGAFGFGFGIFGGGYGGYGRYGGSGRERLTDVVSTGGGGESDNEYDDENVQEQERGQDKPQGRAPSPSHSTASSHQQPPAADSITEAPVPASAQAPVPQDPQAYISFLLVTGCRRTMSFEPETTVGRVKELVWNTWPEDEEWRKDRPPAPSYLRLLYLGRLLQDEDTLTKLKIPLSHSTFPQPTIVHLSIRPYVPPTNGAENGETLNKKMGRLRGRSGDDALYAETQDITTQRTLEVLHTAQNELFTGRPTIQTTAAH